MAIKGKSRSRGARGVARGPKPVYTPVKRPIVQRRGFWIGVLIVVGVALAGGLTYGFVHQHEQDQSRAEAQVKATVMRRFSNELDPIMQTVGQAVAPGSSFKAFSDLTTAIQGLSSGDTQPTDAATTATQATSSAKAAATAISKIDAVGIVGGKTNDPTFVQYVISAKDELAGAMRLYEQLAQLTIDATKAPDDVRPSLVERAQALAKIAAASLNRGYDWYVQAQGIAGTFRPTTPGASGALPGGVGVTGAGIRPTGSTGAGGGATTGSTGASGSGNGNGR